MLDGLIIQNSKLTIKIRLKTVDYFCNKAYVWTGPQYVSEILEQCQLVFFLVFWLLPLNNYLKTGNPAGS